MHTYRLNYGFATEIGYMRKANQDTVAAHIWSSVSGIGENDVGLFIVADGLGPQGKEASQLACEIVIREVDAYLGDLSHPTNTNTDEPFSILRAAIRTANQAILTQTPKSGTTFTSALVVGHSLYIAHLGDSRVYLVSGNDTQQLTTDHTLSYKYLQRGIVTADQLRTSTVDDVLYRALGQTETLEIDTKLTNILPNTWLLLCTNGLIKWDWGIISQEEVHTTLSQNEPQLAADTLVALAKARESYYDISAIVVKFDTL